MKSLRRKASYPSDTLDETLWISVGIGRFFMLRQRVGNEHEHSKSINEKIKLPEPKYDSNTSIEKALRERGLSENIKMRHWRLLKFHSFSGLRRELPT